MKEPRAKKAIKVESGPLMLNNGNILEPLRVVTKDDAYRASLLMLFKHVADMHMAVTEIISEKYDIPEEDIIQSITNHPKWTEMMIHPLIHDMTQECGANIHEPEEAKPEGKKRGRKPMTAEEKEARAAEKKLAVTATAPVTAPVVAPVTVPVPEVAPTKPTKPTKPKKTKIVIATDEPILEF